MNNIQQYKCVLTGAENVGKTSIVNRIIKNTFNENSGSTVGISFISKKTKVCDHKECNEKCNNEKCNNENCFINIEFWDTAGQERFASMISFYYRDASIVLLVFSWEEFEYTWNRLIQLYNEILEKSNAKIIIVGSKSDVSTSEKDIQLNIVKKFIDDDDKMNILDFIITSSKTGAGIKELLLLVTKYIKNKNINEKTYKINILEKYETTSCCVVS